MNRSYDGKTVFFSYKGYSYHPEKEYEEDNIKIFHNITTPEGKPDSIKMTPYETITEENFQRWIDMGCPQAERGNLFNKEIDKLWSIHKECSGV